MGAGILIALNPLVLGKDKVATGHCVGVVYVPHVSCSEKYKHQDNHLFSVCCSYSRSDFSTISIGK